VGEDSPRIQAAAEIAKAVVALRPTSENHRPPEQARIGGAVRAVAHFAAVHADRGMLVDKGPRLSCGT